MDLHSALATSKTIDSSEMKPVSRQNIPTFTGSVESIDEMVYGGVSSANLVPPQNTYDPSNYDPKAEMKLYENAVPVNANTSRMPSAIRDSILKNPLFVKPEDPKMDALTERIANKMGINVNNNQPVTGVGKATSIIDRLNEVDERKEMEKQLLKATNSSSNVGGVDYSLIKTIVEGVVDNKINELKSAVLNESAGLSPAPNLKVMKFTDKFLFLDENDNIYECQMVFKGKKKKK